MMNGFTIKESRAYLETDASTFDIRIVHDVLNVEYNLSLEMAFSVFSRRRGACLQCISAEEQEHKRTLVFALRIFLTRSDSLNSFKVDFVFVSTSILYLSLMYAAKCIARA